MNLGLGNLNDLKTYITHPSLQADTSFDTLLQALGKGVAAALEKHCARKFERTAGSIDEFTGDRTYWILQRYPIESITTIEQRDDMATGFIALTANDAIINRADKAGRIEFGARLGSYLSQIKVTYTGGFWFETLEPADVGYPSAMPGGATLLDPDLKLAWQMQVNALFRKRDALNLVRAAADNPEAASTIQAFAALPLLPEVERMLSKFIRYA